MYYHGKGNPLVSLLFPGNTQPLGTGHLHNMWLLTLGLKLEQKMKNGVLK